MKNSRYTPSYKHNRYPVEVIHYAVWLYFRFCLSYLDVEDLLAECGIVVSYAEVPLSGLKFGNAYTLRRRSHYGDT
jgi:putative transposase